MNEFPITRTAPSVMVKRCCWKEMWFWDMIIPISAWLGSNSRRKKKGSSKSLPGASATLLEQRMLWRMRTLFVRCRCADLWHDEIYYSRAKLFFYFDSNDTNLLLVDIKMKFMNKKQNGVADEYDWISRSWLRWLNHCQGNSWPPFPNPLKSNNLK